MKTKLLIVLVIVLGFSGIQAFAQNGNCPELIVSVKKGTVNKIKPTADIEKIQQVFPCFTGVTREDEGYNCGGGVFFITSDFYAYTGRDYWEFRGKFKGSWDTKLLGCKPADIEFQFGDPIREERIPGYKVMFFKQKYGCIRIQFGIQSNRSEEVGIHYKPAAEVELCY
jgi:hypothetical protein